jgi:hypothetical protein
MTAMKDLYMKDGQVCKQLLQVESSELLLPQRAHADNASQLDLGCCRALFSCTTLHRASHLRH